MSIGIQDISLRKEIDILSIFSKLFWITQVETSHCGVSTIFSVCKPVISFYSAQ